jgi:hypothetical protein
VEAWEPDPRSADAVGRDFADVAPLSGTFVADAAGNLLFVRKRLSEWAG